MSYSKQNFYKGMTLEHYHLENIENAILNNEAQIRLLMSANPNEDYYAYEVSTPGVLSTNDLYKKTKIYKQIGQQDGAIYRGLSFRGFGTGTISIKDIKTGESVSSMTWDKKDLLKPHDNSVSCNVNYGERTSLSVDWVVGSSIGSADGNFYDSAGSRARTPKISLNDYKNIEFTVSSCDFAVCCYDENNSYIGQISISYEGYEVGYAQWFDKGTTITESIILSNAPTTAYIAVLAYLTAIPTYSMTYQTEDCYMYSNIYNTYSSATDKHIAECCVYHVAKTNGVWTNTLMQLLKVGFISDTDYWPPSTEARPYGNFVVDPINKFLYVYTMYTAKNLTYWYKFALPDVNGGEYNETYGCPIYTLSLDDVLDSWTTTYQNFVQGACVYNGLVWTTEGFNGTTPPNVARMRVIDPSAKREIAIFNFYADNDPWEPEFVDFYDGVCYYGSARSMYTVELL